MTKQKKSYNPTLVAFRLAGMKMPRGVKLANPAKGISERELATILAKSTPQMRAQIERQLGPAESNRESKSAPKKVRGRRAKTTWGKDNLIDRLGRAISKTRLRRALNPNPIQKVTPAVARRWLKTAKSKADMVWARVGSITKSMKAGTYKAKSPLLFKEGKLVDGRHRLEAVVRSGKTIEFPIERVAAVKNPKAKAENNMFGLDKKSRKKRARKRSAKQAYKADQLEARARYLRSLNPAQQKVAKKVLSAVEKNPMHPLEIGSNLAMILSGIHTAGEMAKRPKKQPRPSATAAGKRLAQRKHGSVRGQTKIVKRKLRNSAGEIFEDFTGTPSTQVTTGYVAANAPKDVDQLTHDVVHLAIETPNGKPIQIGSERDGTARMIRGELIRFQPEAVKLCAVEQNGKRRFVTTVRAADRAKWLQRNPGMTGNYKRGVVAEVVYRARKPHLYGHNRMLNFYHIVGEEGGRRPTAYLKNGCPSLNYGAWEITAEGIKN